MSAIYYKVTSTNVPGLGDFHDRYGLGYAYETDTHYVHFYGYDRKFYSIQMSLGVVENKLISQYHNLSDWVSYYFGAKDIRPIKNPIGETIEGVWRPALYYSDDIHLGLNTNESERRLSQQALKILLEKLDDLFLYIEPTESSMSTYSHKTRELLILACTEIENFWMHYMQISDSSAVGKNHNTKDYVKLKEKLHLHEYSFTLKGYPSIPPINPFKDWDKNSPTISLKWYDAYNKTKHNRTNNFYQATLLNTLTAVIGNIVLYIVKYGPYSISEENGIFNSIINQHFSFELENPLIGSFYIPKIKDLDNYIEISPVDTYNYKLLLPYEIKSLSL